MKLKLKDIKKELKYTPHKDLFIDPEKETIVSVHNSLENAICMLITMSQYSEKVELHYISSYTYDSDYQYYVELCL